MKVCSTEKLKKAFIIIAYLCYCTTTVLENHMQLSLGYYNYVFVFIIGVCLKLANNVEVIEKIINNYEIPAEDLAMIRQRLESIVETNSRSISQRSNIIEVPEIPVSPTHLDRGPTEPITPTSDIVSVRTHRDYLLPSGDIIRIKI